MELEGRNVLVTGAGRRVGRAIAIALGTRGMRVAVHYHGSRDGADETVDAIRAAGSEAVCVAADLIERGSADQLIHDVHERLGPLDVLVNSAAVMLRTPLGAVSAEEWDTTMSLNLRAPFFLAQAAAPALRKRRGAIINIADLAGIESWPAYIPHGVSKAGVIHMTRALARTLAPEVRVNAIAPGAVMLPESRTEDDAQRLVRTTPLRRLGSPDDVTQAIVYLLQADYVTGEVLIVDGGRHVR